MKIRRTRKISKRRKTHQRRGNVKPSSATEGGGKELLAAKPAKITEEKGRERRARHRPEKKSKEKPNSKAKRRSGSLSCHPTKRVLSWNPYNEARRRNMAEEIKFLGRVTERFNGGKHESEKDRMELVEEGT